MFIYLLRHVYSTTDAIALPLCNRIYAITVFLGCWFFFSLRISEAMTCVLQSTRAQTKGTWSRMVRRWERRVSFDRWRLRQLHRRKWKSDGLLLCAV